jgi:hypothetical protein
MNAKPNPEDLTMILPPDAKPTTAATMEADLAGVRELLAHDPGVAFSIFSAGCATIAGGYGFPLDLPTIRAAFLRWAAVVTTVDPADLARDFNALIAACQTGSTPRPAGS